MGVINGDGRVISLIHRYLNAGVIVNHTFRETEIGVHQGGPLSPLLRNIMLNELDQELERRGHRFVRYADDMMIFCKSRKGKFGRFLGCSNYPKCRFTVNVEKI